MLLVIGQIFLVVGLLVPAAIYGGIIGNRIARNEFNGILYKRILLSFLFAIIGMILAPLSVLLMLISWDNIERDLDRLFDGLFGLRKRKKHRR